MSLAYSRTAFSTELYWSIQENAAFEQLVQKQQVGVFLDWEFEDVCPEQEAW